MTVEAKSRDRSRSQQRQANGHAHGTPTHLASPRDFDGSLCPLIITGVWQLSSGHSDRVAEQLRTETITALKAYAESGLWCFDCADIYTGVEALLGEVCSATSIPMRFHTKCVPDLDVISDGKVTREYLEAGILRSAGRLRIDVVDLVQFHWWDYESPGFGEAFLQLCALLDTGLVRAVGLTNTDLPHLKELVNMGGKVASNQIQFSLLDRRPIESGMVSYCQENGIELLCYGVLAGGFLSERWLGKDDPGFEGLENRSLTKYRLIIDEYGTWAEFQQLLRLLHELAQFHSTSIPAVATGWVLRQPARTRAILGARGAAHVGGAAAGLEVSLSDADMKRLDTEVAGKGVKGEVFGVERAGGRHTGVMRRNLNGIASAAHVSECLERARLAKKTGIAPKLLNREIELLQALGADVSQLIDLQ